MICFYFLKLSYVVFNDTLSLKSWSVVLKRLGQDEPGQDDDVYNVNVIEKLYKPWMTEQIVLHLGDIDGNELINYL